MIASASRLSRGGLLLLLIGGCTFPVREAVDDALCQHAARPLDLQPAAALAPAKPTPTQPPTGVQKGLPERLKIPPELPGAGSPPIQLPPSTAPREEREAAINRLYPPLPPIQADLVHQAGPAGRALTLQDLQRLAATNSPNLRQATADVEAARGAAIQAGLYPNPTIGYEGDTISQADTAGMQGGFVEQTIKTGGKLKLAQAAARMDLANAELALRAAQNQVVTKVRAGYFGVLVARDTVQAAKALSRFTEEVHRVQVEQVKGEQAAPYEPLQLRVLAVQARGALVQAQNRHAAAWRELAAALGLPGTRATELAGRAETALPHFEQDLVLAQVLDRHTDILSARNAVAKARYQLRLAELTPVPDVSVRIMVQKDYTTPPNKAVTSVAVGVPLPVWDRNQGGIVQAQSNLLRATEAEHSARTELTAHLATAFERYDNARTLLDYYRIHMLPDQVRAYRGVYERHDKEPDRVSFGDIVNAQQVLAASITTYLSTLASAWSAVVDVASLLQTTDLFQQGTETCHAPILDLSQLPALPCQHPDCQGCSPVSAFSVNPPGSTTPDKAHRLP